MTARSKFSVIILIVTALFFVIACENKELDTATQTPTIDKCKRTSDMPEKLRLDNYRAPTPLCVPHGVTINTLELKALIKDKPELVLIDVLSIIARPNSEFGEVEWIPNKDRLSLPHGVWLPNVGYGHLDEEMEHYFKKHLSILTEGNNTKPLVFFCIADCWMSWNAVLRAYEYGYSNLYWYKNGTDGWLQHGFQTNKIIPVALEERE
jgi:PQQ-dependent catabolism-associated CXXCW motif protein